MNRVKGYRNVVTQGTYMGEEGTGYAFGELSEYGDFSQATRGHIQGYTQPCAFEILVPGAEVFEIEGSEALLYPAVGQAFFTKHGHLGINEGVPAGTALAYGLIRLIEE